MCGPQEAAPTKPQCLAAAKKAATTKDRCRAPKKRTAAAQTMSRSPKRPRRNPNVSQQQKSRHDEGSMSRAPKKARATQNNVARPQKAAATNHQCLAPQKKDATTKDRCRVPPRRTAAKQNNVAQAVPTKHQRRGLKKKPMTTKKLECRRARGIAVPFFRCSHKPKKNYHFWKPCCNKPKSYFKYFSQIVIRFITQSGKKTAFPGSTKLLN